MLLAIKDVQAPSVSDYNILLAAFGVPEDKTGLNSLLHNITVCLATIYSALTCGGDSKITCHK